MAQASSRRSSFILRGLANLLDTLSGLELSPKVVQDLQQQFFSRNRGWAIVAFGATVLVFWDGRLVLSTGMGIAAMLAVYNWRDRSWRDRLPDLKQWLQFWQQPFVLASSSGILATVLTYWGISIWLETEQHWIAAGMVLQGILSLSVLGLLLAQRSQDISAADREDHQDLQQWMQDLAHEDSIRRLLAVRELSDRLKANTLEAAQVQRIVECFRLMLSRETEEIIQEAIWEGLEIVSRTTDSEPRQIAPSVLQQMAKPMQKVPAQQQRILEEVE